MAPTFDAPWRWGIVLAAFLALSGSSRASGVEAGSSPNEPPTLVFVTQSDACDCVASLCVAGEQEVLNFMASNPWGFRRETVDLTKTPVAAKDLGVLAVPVVFLVDGQGKRVARFDGVFAGKDFSRAWEAHLASKGK
jgi:hypothetical protein